jgi:hypothetical protein
MSLGVPLFVLDQEVRAAFRALTKARRDARATDHGALDAPLGTRRRVSSKDTLDELADAKDPLVPALRTWVHSLTLTRVLWADRARVVGAWNAPSIRLEEPETEEVAPRTLVHRVLAEKEPGLAARWMEALTEGASPASHAARRYAERRAEATTLLRAPEAARAEVPCEKSDVATELAEAVLRATDDLVRPADSLSATLRAGLATSADRGWPARLNARWLEELFHATELTHGLALDIGPLPRPLGAASFARALALFGAAFAEASLADGAPFVLARAPFDLRVARRASLFGGLVTEPVFLGRALGLGRGFAEDQARETAAALVATLRLDALRVLLRGVLLAPERVRASRFEELSARTLGAPLPPSFVGVLPVLGTGDVVRLFGHVLAARDREVLVASHDEDWFRSPHAAHTLRDEQATPGPLTTTAEALFEGAAALSRALATALG